MINKLLSVLESFRQKYLFWIGGWETSGGWEFYSKKYGFWNSPFPCMFLGFITIYSWGFDIHLFKTRLCGQWRGRKQLYVSPDGTPSMATHWVIGKRS